MFLNKLIIKQRKALKISQSQLASGICTQATVSKMENQGLAPSSQTLVQICERLNLTLNDVFSDFNDETKEKLQEKIDRSFTLMSAYRFDEAEKIINTIDEKQSQEKHLKTVLYFLKGNLALNQRKDFDEAQYYFNWILEEKSNQRDSYERLLALNGLGIIYFQKNKLQIADHYFEEIYEVLLVNQRIFVNKKRIHILSNLANFYASKKDYEKSLQVIEYSLEIIKQTQDFSYIERLLYLKAYNLFQIKDDDMLVEQTIKQAQVFAQFNGNQIVEEYVDYYLQNKRFKNTKNAEEQDRFILI